jgi:hypothetical protein
MQSAEADITYSGVLNQPFADSNPTGPGGHALAFFSLGPNASFGLIHGALGPSTNYAGFYLIGAVSAMFRGSAVGNYRYPSRLATGINVSTGTFVQNVSNSFAATLAYQFVAGNFRDPGIGFVGFKFDGGAGTQFGWLRLQMNGAANGNTFTLVDYAFADPKEQIATGQIPEPGSLGLLALGGAGLLAWRKRRAASAGQAWAGSN